MKEYLLVTFGFCSQLIHGLVDRIMQVIGAVSVPVGDNTGYYLKHSEVSIFSHAFDNIGFIY